MLAGKDEDAAYAAEYDHDAVIAERNALRGELAQLKARKCETCRHHEPVCWIEEELKAYRGKMHSRRIGSIGCSEWEAKEEGWKPKEE
jgi:hypothetical protein